MSNSEKKDVKFLTSLALAVTDSKENVRHVQLTLVEELESNEIRAFMDVVDSSKIKLQDVSESDNP